MGRSKICKLIIRSKRDHYFYGEWYINNKKQFLGYGKPTPENLSKWRDKFNESLKPGNANSHLGSDYRIQRDLEIYNQVTGEILAEYKAPMFEVIN